MTTDYRAIFDRLVKCPDEAERIIAELIRMGYGETAAHEDVARYLERLESAT